MSYRDQLLTSDSRLPPVPEDRRLAAALSPRRLEVFRVTAATGSVTRAARLLDLSQPTVSQHLRALETELGRALFERRAGRLMLTAFGTAFLSHATAMLRQQEALQLLLAETSGRPGPPLRIAGLPSVLQALVPGAIGRVLQENPARTFDLQEADTATVLAMLEAGQADVALVDLTAADPLPEGFAAEGLLSDPWFLVAPSGITLPDGLCADGAEALAEISPSVQLPSGSGAGQASRAWFAAKAPGQSVVARVRSYSGMLGLVRQGLGVCLAPGLTLSLYGKEGVQLRPVDLPARKIGAVYSGRRKCRARTALLAALSALCADEARLRPDLPEG